MDSARQWSSTDLVVETALRLQVVEELAVRFTTPELHIRDFEIAPNYAAPVSEAERTRMDGSLRTRTVTHVVSAAFIVREEGQRVVGVEVLRILIGELCHTLSDRVSSEGD